MASSNSNMDLIRKNREKWNDQMEKELFDKIKTKNKNIYLEVMKTRQYMNDTSLDGLDVATGVSWKVITGWKDKHWLASMLSSDITKGLYLDDKDFVKYMLDTGEKGKSELERLRSKYNGPGDEIENDEGDYTCHIL